MMNHSSRSDISCCDEYGVSDKEDDLAEYFKLVETVQQHRRTFLCDSVCQAVIEQTLQIDL